jgi:glycosyltransferase involved in cell wall biosynthesis
MIDTTRTDIAERVASPLPAGTAGKVLVLTGDDSRETTAHCHVLIDALHGMAREMVVVGRYAGGEETEARPIGRIDLDCGGDWHGPLAKAGDAWRLARIIEAERPSVVHAIGVRPAALAGLALRLAHAERTVVHLPDLRALAAEPGGLAWPYRHLAVRLLASLLRRPGSFLLVEREDDLGELRQWGIDPGARFAVLGGAGVDPDVYPVLPPSQSEMPVAAYVGPLDAASGLKELLQAFERLWARGLRLQLDICGERTADNGAGPLPDWDRASLHPGVRLSGCPADTREIWRRAEICVWSAHARQGLPRALLEAAACGRALIVSDTAAGAAFVRHEVEGLIVPARDSTALGAALEQLARDAGLRQRMGGAARLRVLQGYTEAHVQGTLRGAYLALMSGFRD